MEARAQLNYCRIAPRKVKILCDLIRGKDIGTQYWHRRPKRAANP